MSFYDPEGEDYTGDYDWASGIQSVANQPVYQYAPMPDYSSYDWEQNAPPRNLSYYTQPAVTAQPNTNPVTGVTNWAKNNPKDVLGILTGLGLGAAGLMTGGAKYTAPNMAGPNATNAALMQEITRMQQQGAPMNAAALARLTDLLSGKYGEYNDSNVLRQEANRQIMSLLAEPSKMLPEDNAKMVALDEYYKSRNLLGSSIYTKARAQLLEEIQNTQDQRKAAQVASLQGISTGQNAASRGIYQDVENAVGQGNQTNQTAIAGLSNLYTTGLKQAADENRYNDLNTEAKNQRSAALATTGGNIFGRAISPSYSDFLKSKLAG